MIWTFFAGFTRRIMRNFYERTQMTRIEEIYAEVLPTMKEHEIEDTTENRVVFLQGLYDAWKEDEETSLEKTFYMLTLHSEIMLLKMKLMFPNILK